MPDAVHDTIDNERGPLGYENWQKAIQGLPAQYSNEVPLYSDAYITGEIDEGWGPYQALNTIGVLHQPACVPVIVLRTKNHRMDGNIQVPDMKSTNTSNYHGGGIAEEISALIGLALGIRLRPSSETRFCDHATNHERPRAEEPASVPVLISGQSRHPILPHMRKTVLLEKRILAGYPDIPPKSAIALVRASRLFQHGLWLSESNPNDAWLMLVSAAEVAAVHWRASEVDDNQEKLFRNLKPEWANRLDQAGDSSLVKDMAAHWANLLGSTNRFLKFLQAHLPEAPTERPQFGRVEWDKKKMRTALEQIYSYRSNALHAGIPFPVPMCSPPLVFHEENKVPAEKPNTLASSAKGGVWTQKDLPMHLHIFAYIVQRSLLKWWDGLKRGEEQEQIDLE